VWTPATYPAEKPLTHNPTRTNETLAFWYNSSKARHFLKGNLGRKPYIGSKMESDVFMKEPTPEIHKKDAKKTYSFGLITISTSRYEKYGNSVSPEKADDLSGKVMKDFLKISGHEVAFYRLVPDEKNSIIGAVLAALDSSADIIITSGGTGLAPKDLTIESLTPFFEKEIPGFGELFRYKSLEEIGTSVILTRTAAGVIKGKTVFCLPGSPNAVKLALSEIIIPEAGHIVRHVRE
jgi:molybdopterin adenylyltransferase